MNDRQLLSVRLKPKHLTPPPTFAHSKALTAAATTQADTAVTGAAEAAAAAAAAKSAAADVSGSAQDRRRHLMQEYCSLGPVQVSLKGIGVCCV